ncbi:MAG: hypothetical protein Q9211_001391 [Gyalolechia sp. 1 TL-2023]
MPTFHARAINVRLSVAQLDKTITPTPLNTLCKDSTLNADRATQQFEDDAVYGTLPETPLGSDEDKCRLGYLGECQDMPFLMVHTKPAYPFNQDTGIVSKAKKKPPPLQLPTVNGAHPDSPLTEPTSSPLTPVSALDTIGSQDVHVSGKNQAHSRPRRPSIRPLDRTEGAEKDLLPASFGLSEQTLSNVASNSAVSLANEIRPAGTYSSGKDSFGTRSLKTPQPQALCLRVLPTRKSFLCSRDPAAAWSYNDIKIDVYLNGDLCASSYVPERAYPSKKYTQDTFSGCRNGRLTEKPWVLVPPVLDILEDSANPIELKRVEEDARSRWTAISDTLDIAAESHGRNFRNELSVIGQYLQSLAAIPMPPTLPSMLNTDHKRFAIIDVLVTSGKGSKDPVQGSYLMRPLSLKLYGYRGKQESPVVREQESLEKQQPVARDPLPRPKKSFADQQIALQSHHVPRSSAGELECGNCLENQGDTKLGEDPSIYQAAREGILFQRSMPGASNTPEITETEQAPIWRPPTSARKNLPRVRKAPQSSQGRKPDERRSRSQSNSRKRTLTPVLVEHQAGETCQGPTTSKDVPPKRRRIQYHDVIDTRQTQAEEMEDITRQAAEKDAILTTERRITRSKLANTFDSPEVTEKPMAPEAVLKLYDSQAKLPNSRSGSALASLPKSKKHRDVLGVASPKPLPSQPLPASEPHALSRRRRDGSSPPVLVNRAESSSPEKPLMFRRNRSSTSISDLQPAPQGAFPSRVSPHEGFAPAPASTKPGSSDTNAASRPVKRSSSKKKSSVNTNKLAAWEVPPLSKDSIVTYPDDGAERQIKAERGGWFREEEVLVGVRFVIG